MGSGLSALPANPAVRAGDVRAAAEAAPPTPCASSSANQEGDNQGSGACAPPSPGATSAPTPASDDLPYDQMVTIQGTVVSNEALPYRHVVIKLAHGRQIAVYTSMVPSAKPGDMVSATGYLNSKGIFQAVSARIVTSTPSPGGTPTATPSGTPPPGTPPPGTPPPGTPPPGTPPPGPGTSQVRLHTAGYLLGYNGAKLSPGPQLDVAAKSLDLIETASQFVDAYKQSNPQGKAMAYTDPQRLITGEPVLAYLPEAGFAHCNGNRLTGTYSGGQRMYQMDVRTPEAVAGMTREFQGRARGKMDYVFSDDTTQPVGMQCMPDGYDPVGWAQADAMYLNTVAANTGVKIIYNGAGTHNPQYSDYLQAQPNIDGGMIENCFNDRQDANPVGPYVHDGLWVRVAQAFLRMQNYAHKQMTLCLGNDRESAASAPDIRTYTLASFLMFYDPATSYMWEMFRTSSGVTVEPESGLVALNPVIPTPNSSTVAAVNSFDCGSVHCREYNDCYLNGARVGYCAVEVNSITGQSLPGARWPSGRSYGRTLNLTGSGIVSVGGSVPSDNGRAQIVAGSPPTSLCSPGNAQRASITGCKTAAILFQ